MLKLFRLLHEEDGAQSGKTEEKPLGNTDGELEEIDQQLEEARQKILAELDESEEQDEYGEEDPAPKDEQDPEPEEKTRKIIDKPKEEPKQAKDNDVIEVNEDYLNSLGQEDRQYLAGVKGEKLSGKALKNYLHAQKLIAENRSTADKTAEKKTDQQAITGEQFNKSDGKVSLTEQQISEQRSNYVFGELKRKYPDIPEDFLTNRETRKGYLQDLYYDDIEAGQELLNMEKDLYGVFDDTVKDFKHKSENWETINKDILNRDVREFEEELKEYGVTSKDLGFEYTDDFVLSNLTEDMLQKEYGGSLVFVKPGSFKQKLMQMAVKPLLDKSSKKGLEEGIERGRRVKNNPSMSNAGAGASDEEIGVLDFSPDADLEEMEGTLEKMKARILKEDGETTY